MTINYKPCFFQQLRSCGLKSRDHVPLKLVTHSNFQALLYLDLFLWFKHGNLQNTHSGSTVVSTINKHKTVLKLCEV